MELVKSPYNSSKVMGSGQGSNVRRIKVIKSGRPDERQSGSRNRQEPNALSPRKMSFSKQPKLQTIDTSSSNLQGNVQTAKENSRSKSKNALNR